MALKKSLFIFSTIIISTMIILTFAHLFSTVSTRLTTKKEYPVTLHHQGKVNTLGRLTLRYESDQTLLSSNSIQSGRYYPSLKTVFLTFDDGPSKYTNNILDILSQYQIKASFFLLKRNIEVHPEIVTRMVEDGHTIGCHGVSHKVSTFFESPQSALHEIESCSETVSKYTGSPTKYFRVPFGSYPYMTQPYRELLKDSGYTMWDWNIDSYDWKTGDPQIVLSNVQKQLNMFENNEWSPVILLHDREVTSKALVPLIDLLQKNGYIFSTITENVKPVTFKVAE